MTDLRYAQHMCEHCHRRTELWYHDSTDEYLCDNCIQSLAETSWERHVEDFHDGGSTRFKSLAEIQHEARKLK